MERATELFRAYLAGGKQAAADLVPLVYDELHSVAQRLMRRERQGHTLSPTALVHEAYLRMIEREGFDVNGKTHFCALAATTMRRVLVNFARARQAKKRKGDGDRITITDNLHDFSQKEPLDILAFDEALTRLSEKHERQGRVVEMRFFGALKVPEIARMLEVSEKTIKEDWRAARAWLLCELDGVEL